eukprot:1995901-Amphidinium_carterae.2
MEVALEEVEKAIVEEDLPDFDVPSDVAPEKVDGEPAVVSDEDDHKHEPVLHEGEVLERKREGESAQRVEGVKQNAVNTAGSLDVGVHDQCQKVAPEAVPETLKNEGNNGADVCEAEQILVHHLSGHTMHRGDLRGLVEEIAPTIAMLRSEVKTARQLHFKLFSDVVAGTWEEMWHASFTGRKKRREAIESIVWTHGGQLVNDEKKSKRGLWETLEALDKILEAMDGPWKRVQVACHKARHSQAWNALLRSVGVPSNDDEKKKNEEEKKGCMAPQKSAEGVWGQTSGAQSSQWKGEQWKGEHWRGSEWQPSQKGWKDWKACSEGNSWSDHKWEKEKWLQTPQAHAWKKWDTEDVERVDRVNPPPPPPPALRSQLGTEWGGAGYHTSDADETVEEDDESGTDETWSRREQETVIAARVRTEVARQLHERERAFKRTSDEDGMKGTHTGWKKFGLLEKIEHRAKARRMESSDQSERKASGTPPWRREKNATSRTVPPPPVPVVPTEQGGRGEQPHEWTWPPPPPPPVAVGQGQVNEQCSAAAHTTPVPPLAVRAPGGGFRKLPNPPTKK